MPQSLLKRVIGSIFMLSVLFSACLLLKRTEFWRHHEMGTVVFTLIPNSAEELVFDIKDNLYFGNFALSVNFKQIDGEKSREAKNTSIRFNFLVKMTQNRKEVEKNILVPLYPTVLGGDVYLFNIPKDFSFVGNVTISIKNIVYDDAFAEYYQGVSFSLIREAWWKMLD